MYSLATNCKKWTAFITRLFVSIIVLIYVSACSDEKNFVLPPAPKDTTPPSIASSLPDENNSNNFEVDDIVQITFSERMNIDSLLNGGIKLFSGQEEQASDQNDNEPVELSERESTLAFSEEPVTSQDLVTGEDIQIPGTKIVLTPSSGRFALNTAYTVKVEFPARDLVEDDLETAVDERNFIDGSNIVDFITEKGEWKSSQSLPNIAIDMDGNGDEIAVEQAKTQLSPLVVSNKNGDVFAIWLQEGLTPGINQLWFSRYLVNESRWLLADSSKQVCLDESSSQCANAERIDIHDASSTFEYHAAINNKGQIAVAWSNPTLPGDFTSIWARLYDGEKWLEATEISSTGFNTKTGHADSPQIAIDDQGNVVSIWREHNASSSRIKTNIFKAGANGNLSEGAWVEAPSFIDDNSSTSTRTPKLAINTSGLAIAVWSQLQANNLRIYSNRIQLNQSDDWSQAVQIDDIDSSLSEGAGDSTFPNVAIGGNGDAMAIWLKHDGIRNNVWYNRFTGSWGNKASRLEEDRTGDADYPTIDISRDNKVLVVWTQKNNTSNSTQLKSRFFEASKGWDMEQTISSSNQIHKPVAKFDREGNINLIWQQAISEGALVSSYYSKLTDIWTETENLADNVNDASLVPLLEDGRFLSVWEQVDSGKHFLKFRRFSD